MGTIALFECPCAHPLAMTRLIASSVALQLLATFLVIQSVQGKAALITSAHTENISQFTSRLMAAMSKILQVNARGRRSGQPIVRNQVVRMMRKRAAPRPAMQPKATRVQKYMLVPALRLLSRWPGLSLRSKPKGIAPAFGRWGAIEP